MNNSIISSVVLLTIGHYQTMAAVCPFPTARDAVNATVDILQVGIPVAKIGKVLKLCTHTHTHL